ncbi:hypothetical protein IOK49_04315 [Fervidicoccus fontis]|jgi:glutaredoxin|uniref:Glutaredoxin domain-containing protein n=2 Tax=Fervidicoccus fontis TaxID=683846 RepID=I0A161_FERFK|nr:glutaredoxin domain-containing protein [Fervidicoccus fontis]AFH42718.1 hypothetical protein FFONT_0730 [Fervidicoccus fontis Kam940]MBE9391296.1 hypothetical protein [Fervidicoccus fontis]PMB75574.1 MAG: glutaredoxin 3 [Fervidicoccus fontis]PMB78422.1 MAG: glutaredoxin 3 [Fervidicoccus fontis]HEW64347.1 hypothetical protein [Fervidicoccus fontis]
MEEKRKLVVYGLKGCSPCERAFLFLKKAGIEFEYVEISNCDDANIEEVLFYEDGEALLPLILDKKTESILIGCPKSYERFIEELRKSIKIYAINDKQKT